MQSFNYGIVKASFAGCSLIDRESFSIAEGMLLISVGQPYHEGEKFKATIALVNRRFKSCMLMVADTLQRYNIQAQQDIEEKLAYKQSLIKGDEWLSRNKSSIEILSIPYKILRWDDYLANEQFSYKLDFVKTLYSQNNSFKIAINATIEEYINRANRSSFSSEKILYLKKYCLGYLLEECAIMLLWWQQGIEFEIYPTPRNAAMRAIYENIIQPIDKKSLKPVFLRFKRYVSKAVDQLEKLTVVSGG